LRGADLSRRARAINSAAAVLPVAASAALPDAAAQPAGSAAT
jgi:hypothetical protein